MKTYDKSVRATSSRFTLIELPRCHCHCRDPRWSDSARTSPCRAKVHSVGRSNNLKHLQLAWQQHVLDFNDAQN